VPFGVGGKGLPRSHEDNHELRPTVEVPLKAQPKAGLGLIDHGAEQRPWQYEGVKRTNKPGRHAAIDTGLIIALTDHLIALCRWPINEGVPSDQRGEIRPVAVARLYQSIAELDDLPVCERTRSIIASGICRQMRKMGGNRANFSALSPLRAPNPGVGTWSAGLTY